MHDVLRSVDPGSGVRAGVAVGPGSLGRHPFDASNPGRAGAAGTHLWAGKGLRGESSARLGTAGGAGPGSGAVWRRVVRGPLLVTGGGSRGGLVCGAVRNRAQRGARRTASGRSRVLPVLPRRPRIAVQARDGVRRPLASHRRHRAVSGRERDRRRRVFPQSRHQRLRRSAHQRELGPRGSTGVRRDFPRRDRRRQTRRHDHRAAPRRQGRRPPGRGLSQRGAGRGTHPASRVGP